ncbi:hypothetical protein Tcan_07986 [Toxocara canis]|uniref:DUF4605 domain-containing protein n=1 Tax=Toxocara canis TaxID=6265 RepID=A0A0B2V7K4_TOXCA|nr:hypothetical protein Tcan_07986 [Toxocara canis]
MLHPHPDLLTSRLQISGNTEIRRQCQLEFSTLRVYWKALMVRITNNGDIVDDDEVRTPRSPVQPDNSVGLRRSNLDIADGRMHTPANPWTVVNARLSEYGIPTYSLYGYRFEPIHFIFTLAAVILLGVQSLLLIPILVIVSNLSASSGKQFIVSHTYEQTDKLVSYDSGMIGLLLALSN